MTKATKKITAIILSIVMLFTVLPTGFVLADDANSSYAYVVADSKPAIPAKQGTVIDLSKIAVEFKDAVVAGSDITWSATDTSGGVSVNDASKVIAVLGSDDYTVTATSGEESKTIYIMEPDANGVVTVYDKIFEASDIQMNASNYGEFTADSEWKATIITASGNGAIDLNFVSGKGVGHDNSSGAGHTTTGLYLDPNSASGKRVAAFPDMTIEVKVGGSYNGTGDVGPFIHLTPNDDGSIDSNSKSAFASTYARSVTGNNGLVRYSDVNRESFTNAISSGTPVVGKTAFNQRFTVVGDTIYGGADTNANGSYTDDVDLYHTSPVTVPALSTATSGTIGLFSQRTHEPYFKQVTVTADLGATVDDLYDSNVLSDVYVVSATKPAIPMVVNKVISLSNIYFEFDNGITALGSQITWSAPDSSDGVTISDEGKTLSLTKAGIYPITANFGDEVKTFYVTDYDSNNSKAIYNHTFSASDLSSNPISVGVNAPTTFGANDEWTMVPIYVGGNGNLGFYTDYQYNSGAIAFNTNWDALFYLNSESSIGKMVSSFADYTIDLSTQCHNNFRANANVYLYLLGRYKLAGEIPAFANDTYLGVKAYWSASKKMSIAYTANKFYETGSIFSAYNSANNILNFRLKLSGDELVYSVKDSTMSSYSTVYNMSADSYAPSSSAINASDSGTVAIYSHWDSRPGLDKITITIDFTEEEIANVKAREFRRKVIVGPEGTEYDPATETLFVNDMPGAIAYLGAEGGTVYVKGAASLPAGLEDSNNVAHAPVTIECYGGTSEGNSLYVYNGEAQLYGDIIFKNISLSNYYYFISSGPSITFGYGTTGSFQIGNYYAGKGKNNIIIDSASLSLGDVAAIKTSGKGTTKIDTDITLNKGSINILTLGNYANNVGDGHYLNGDVKFTINGGSVNTVYLAHRGAITGNAGVLGDIIFTMNGGSIGSLNFGASATGISTHNIAFIMNNATMTSSQVVDLGNIQNELVKSETGKWVLIENNVENDKTIAPYISNIDYHITVNGGTAEPVFERTDANDPSSSRLKGFRINTELTGGYAPYANGTSLLPNEEGLYDLSAFEDSGFINITFQKDMSNFVKFRNSFENSYNKLINGEEVNVVYYGGSMTEGYGSSNNWRVLTQNWFNNTFTDATIKHYNCATGESGTFLGAYRNQHDIIPAEPDILFIEYSINDKYFGSSYDDAAARFETIVREVKLAYPDCDIATVLVTDENVLPDAINGKLHTQASAHDFVANKYGIPSIYVGLGLASYFKGIPSENLAAEWDKYSYNSGDIVHLNDLGYGVYYNIVNSFLTEALGGNDTKSYTEKVNIDVTNPSTIVSKYLFDGNRTIIDGEKAVTLSTSDKAATVDTNNNLQTIFNASVAAGGTGFEYSTNVGFSNPLPTTYGFSYPGTITLPANTQGKFIVEFTGTEFAFYSPNFVSGRSFTYSIASKTTGKTIIDNATYTFAGGLALNPITLLSNVKKDTYIITFNMNFASDFRFGPIMYRDASLQTGEYSYGKYYVKYGGTGRGTSPDAPAKSVAWLINNVIANSHSADEIVDIYIMQDDNEVYYNSTIYQTDDASYTAPDIMKGVNAEGHYTSWYSADATTTNKHAATIRIKSYNDGSTAKNYVGTHYYIGRDSSIKLGGPTIFEDVIILFGRSTYDRYIIGNGYSIEYSNDTGTACFPVDSSYGGSAVKWDGTFRTDALKQIPAAIFLGENEYSSAVAGPGGSIIINKAHSGFFNNGTQAYYPNGGTRFVLGAGTANYTYTNPVSLIINAEVDAHVVIGADETATDTTNKYQTTFAGGLNFVFNKTNLLVNDADRDSPNDDNSELDFFVSDMPIVNKGIQLIRHEGVSAYNSHVETNKSKIPQVALASVAEANNVPLWDLQYLGDSPFIELYYENGEIVYGKYDVSKAEGNVVAFNKTTETFTYAKNGVLDLGTEGGKYLVYYAENIDESNDTITVGDTVIAAEDTTVEVAELSANPYSDGSNSRAFIGWQKDGEFISKDFIDLFAGETLEAVYMNYDAATEDFFIEGVQMRVDSTDSIRFVMSVKDEVFDNLEAAGVTLIKDEVSYGALVLPTELTYGLDMERGKPIIHRSGKTLSTPTDVPANNTYAIIKDADGNRIGIQYTVVVAGISGSKLIRNYSVQGYIRYLDANGNEQIIYTDYGQSSLYRVALRVMADDNATETDKAAAKSVVDTVQNDVQAAYFNMLNKSTQTVDNLLGLDNFSITNYSNGLSISDFNIDWDYNDDVADTTATEVLQVTDTHLIYNNSVDKAVANPAVLSAYDVRNSAFHTAEENTIRIMQYAMTANKTIVTGDIFDYLSEGCVQEAKRLIFNNDVNYAGKFGTVGATIGNHEYTRAFGNVADTGTSEENHAWIQNNWVGDDNSIYQMDIVYNDNEKNPVMTISLHNGTNNYSKLTEELYDQFVADLTYARENNIPVLLFQHIGIEVDGGAMTHVTDSSAATMTSFAANASSTGITGQVYNTILDNDDIIKGIFCGHWHEYYYGEITGNNGNKIPQFLLPGNIMGEGYGLKINIQ